jgi:hypothetical protein
VVEALKAIHGPLFERKLRQRQLTDDGNVEISGRDLGEARRA